MIYLDNAATSFPKAPGVKEAILDSLNQACGNANRSSHIAAQRTAMILYECRESIAKLLGIQSEERIAFTMNGTMSLNMAILGSVQKGMRVLTSTIEHNSVMRPLRQLETQGVIELNQFILDKSLQPEWNSFDKALSMKPDILVVTAGSNVIGNIMPLKEITDKAKKVGCKVIVDGAQAIGHIPLDFSEIKADIVCFPGHKGLLGPSGTGVIYVSPDTNIRPVLSGGTGSLSEDEMQPDFYPDMLESGTHNILGISGLNASVKYILKEGIDNIENKKRKLINLLYNGLTDISGINIVSSKPDRNLGIVSILPEKGSISDLTAYLDRNNIAVRMGLHCAPSAHKLLGTFDEGGTVRLSPGVFTIESEIIRTIETIEKYTRG